MTLQEACDVLNKHGYEGRSDHHLEDGHRWSKTLSRFTGDRDFVYIAQGLLRDAGPTAEREPARGEESGG
jgi:hypothetical protein